MDNQSTYLFGKRFRNRLFVGGLPLNTTAQELAEYFSYFSPVIEAKVILDENQIPKGYGFVTFQNEDDVRNVTEMGTLFLRKKKLNLGPAVKKQAPTPVENPELVVVSNQMRGEYYYPVSVPATLRVPNSMAYNQPICPPSYVPVSGYVMTTPEWKRPPQINPPVPANVASTHIPIRNPRRRHAAPRLRRMQRDTV